ncbi:MAG: hypothetical protein ACRDBR_03015, partial [Metamycoplasmataceae bacterium]
MKNKKILQYFSLNTFEICLMGILLACYLIIEWFNSQVLVGPLNIATSFLFYILSGIIFGPFKGAIFSFFLDTFYQLVSGGISFWMWQYAIVPIFVSLLSWFLFYFFNKMKTNETNKMTISLSDTGEKNIYKEKFLFLDKKQFPLLILSALTIIYVVTILSLYNNISNYDKEPVNPYISIIITSIIFIGIFLSYFVFYFLWKKTNNIMYLNTINQVVIVAAVFVLFRWFWGTYAFIAFSEQFLSATKKPFITIMLGISFKSIFTIPIFSIIIIRLNSVVLVLKER